MTSSKAIVSYVLVLCVSGVIALGQTKDTSDQKMVGVWQRGTNAIPSGWGDCYLFYPNHTFRFYFSQTQLAENRIVGVHGQYRIKGDSIYFLPRATEEMIGGRLSKPGPAGYPEWYLKGSKRVVIKQVDPQEQAASIGEFDKTTRSLSIDEVRYYKMKERPEEYFGK